MVKKGKYVYSLSRRKFRLTDSGMVRSLRANFSMEMKSHRDWHIEEDTGKMEQVRFSDYVFEKVGGGVTQARQWKFKKIKAPYFDH